MKVLLVNPSFDYRKFGRFGRFMEPMPCLGLAYIAAVLKQNDIDVEVVDDFVLRMGPSGIADFVKKNRFDIVGISCLTPSAPEVFSIAAAIKKYSGKTLIVLGNIHANVFAEEILRNEPVDIIVYGEGEYAMLELARAAAESKDFSQVKGICFKREGAIVKTAPRAMIENLDSLPFPAWRLFPFKKYTFLSFIDVKKPGLSILGSRGCPYQCTFCCLPGIGCKYRTRSVKSIADEFQYILENFPVKQIGFFDPIFPLSKDFGMEFCEELIRRRLHDKTVWVCETRVDIVDRELLRKMKEAGCRRILFGLESGVEELLNNVNKKCNLEDIRKAIRYAREEGVQTAGLFMIGLPGETKEMTRTTIQFAKELNLDFAKFAITVPFPGSKLYEDLTAKGELKRRDWDNFVTFNNNPKKLVCIPGKISPEELISLQQKAHREFYLRPKMILKQLFKMRTVGIKNLFFGLFSLLTPHRSCE